jgi:hypothetical protein
MVWLPRARPTRAASVRRPVMVLDVGSEVPGLGMHGQR